MTVIVGVISGPTITIGGDSLTSNDYIKTEQRVAKVWSREGLIYGAAGSFRCLEALQFGFKPTVPGNDTELYPYMIGTFIPQMINALRNNMALSEKDGMAHWKGQLMVGLSNTLLVIEDDFSFSEFHESYCATGIGAEVALGSLYSTIEKGTAYDRVLTALRAAHRYSKAVREPFNIISTQDTDVITVS